MPRQQGPPVGYHHPGVPGPYQMNPAYPQQYAYNVAAGRGGPVGLPPGRGQPVPQAMPQQQAPSQQNPAQMRPGSAGKSTRPPASFIQLRAYRRWLTAGRTVDEGKREILNRCSSLYTRFVSLLFVFILSASILYARASSLLLCAPCSSCERAGDGKRRSADRAAPVGASTGNS